MAVSVSSFFFKYPSHLSTVSLYCTLCVTRPTELYACSSLSALLASIRITYTCMFLRLHVLKNYIIVILSNRDHDMYVR
jgi:hypothetical protein